MSDKIWKNGNTTPDKPGYYWLLRKYDGILFKDCFFFDGEGWLEPVSEDGWELLAWTEALMPEPPEEYAGARLYTDVYA